MTTVIGFWRDKPYPVILYLYGHSGTGVRTWAPEGEARPLQCVNTGQTENGFFVLEIGSPRLRLANRVKTHKMFRTPDGKTRVEGNGSWEWKHPLSRT